MANSQPASTAAYSLLPSTPTKAESSSTAYQEKARLGHARAGSLAATAPPAPSIQAGQKWRRLAVYSALALAGVGLVGWIAQALLARPEQELQYTARRTIAYGFETTDVPSEWSCNPFKEPGRLTVDLKDPAKNVWRPYEEACPPSRMMGGLNKSVEALQKKPNAARHRGPSRSHDTTLRQFRGEGEAPFFPWFENATILLLGDSMERLHLADFCDLIGGNATNINPEHPASAPTYRKPLPTILGEDGQETEASIQAKAERRRLEDQWENERKDSWFYTRPWMCDIPEYNATIVSTFMWGLEDMEEVFSTEDFYHGPPTWLQRFRHITLPMLERLAAHTGRPQLLKPTLIEIASGYWDLRAMTEEDFIGAGIPRPYPKESDLSFGEIGTAREERWVKHATEVLQEVARAFPGPKGIRDGPPISWRTMHHPKRNNYTPYARVAPLDALARKTMHELRVSSLATHPTFLHNVLDSLQGMRERYFPREALDELNAVKEARQHDDPTDYGFDERIRVDEIGKLLEGQEHHYRDFLHPDVLPGAYIWGEIILYELKRAFYRIGRSN
ncbi:hypothetical protein JCM10450v2_005533 [Rhodotorula kratochvilovae]